MTLLYSVKKCNSYGFSQTKEAAFDMFSTLNDNVFVICDENRQKNYIDIKPQFKWEIIDENKNKSAIVFVELATIENVQISMPIEHDDIESVQNYIDQNSNIFDDFSKGELTECMDIIEQIYDNGEFLQGKSMNFKFYNFIKLIYKVLKDTVFKTNLLKILSENHSISELELLYPIEYITKNINKIQNSSLFNDIEIIIDEKNTGTSNTMYKTSEHDLKQSTLGNSTQLEAFSKGMFTVIRGKKSANINDGGDRNHDILDILAKNGVVCTPESLKYSSLDRLMDFLASFKSFDVIFIHPSLMNKSIKAEYPSDQGKPEYTMNEGELIAIVFRYLCLKFFGYKGVYDENQREYEYLF